MLGAAQTSRLAVVRAVYSSSRGGGGDQCEFRTCQSLWLSGTIQPSVSREMLRVVAPNAMDRTRLLPITMLLGLTLSGCTVSPWSADSPWLAGGPKTEPPAAVKKSETPKDASHASAATVAAKAQGPELPNAHTMQTIMAELHDLGAVDPQARDRLMEDLRQTDPSLWPLVMEQFNAAVAYRRRVAEAAARAQTPSPPASPQAAPPFGPSFPQLAPSQYAPVQSTPVPPPQSLSQPAPAPMPAAPTAIARRLPSASQEPSWIAGGQRGPQDRGSGGVVAASYGWPGNNQWRQQLAGAIDSLERQLPTHPSTSADTAQYARLRMLNVVAGRTLDGLRLVPAATPATQEFWLQELSGLATCLDVEHIPDDAVRSAEAKAMLVAATAKLGEPASLVVRNLAFCTAVQSFGRVKRFEKNEFAANQEALLYAEIDNFVCVPTPKGYHTSLKSRYLILDAVGKCVAQQDFPPTEEDCQNVRRDFFIGYHLRMPKTIQPGKYVLQLAIEDLDSHKVGQASIEFLIKESPESRAKG